MKTWKLIKAVYNGMKNDYEVPAHVMYNDEIKCGGNIDEVIKEILLPYPIWYKVERNNGYVALKVKYRDKRFLNDMVKDLRKGLIYGK